MQQCLNCGAQITCSCKRRHASDGKLVCVSCIADYEKTLAELKNVNEQEIKESEDKKST